ncbi:hypothetical protein ACVFYP_26630 [Roseomonas sp. F4]
MDPNDPMRGAEAGGVLLLPAALLGFLAYPGALELVVTTPPANDRSTMPQPG